MQELGARLGIRIDEGARVEGLVARLEQRHDRRVVHMRDGQFATGIEIVHACGRADLGGCANGQSVDSSDGQYARAADAPNVTLTVLVPTKDSGSTEGMRPFCWMRTGDQQGHRLSTFFRSTRTSASSWEMVWALCAALPLAFPICPTCDRSIGLVGGDL